MTNPSIVGAVAEREVACALLREGWSVFAPLFDAHGRVDLVGIDPEGRTRRIQVKNSRLMPGSAVLCFRPCSNTSNRPVDYRGEIDLFGVWSPELGKAFLVPVDAAPTRMCSLRLESTANGQSSGVRYARDFVVGSHSGWDGRRPYHAGDGRPDP